MRCLRLVLLLLAAPASAETLVIRADDCAHIVPYEPAADVAYVPGVDVNGQAVAPADLGGGPSLAMPDEIPIKIKIDLNERLGLPGSADLYDAEARIGVVRYRDGALTFNGQPLDDGTEAALIEACKAHRKAHRKDGRKDGRKDHHPAERQR